MTIPRKGTKLYHIGLEKEDVGEYVILCGDPARTRKISGQFDAILFEGANREFVTCTGTIRGVRITAMSTGIGPDNTEIALVELREILPPGCIIIRCGSSGALQRWVKVGDVVISTGAVRLEETTIPYTGSGYPALPDYGVLALMRKTITDEGIHFGVTATADGFYARQGRIVHPNLNDNLLKEMMALGVLNFEMETSALFILSHVFWFRAASVCGVYANRVTGEFASHDALYNTDKKCINIVINTIMRLAEEG